MARPGGFGDGDGDEGEKRALCEGKTGRMQEMNLLGTELSTGREDGAVNLGVVDVVSNQISLHELVGLGHQVEGVHARSTVGLEGGMVPDHELEFALEVREDGEFGVRHDGQNGLMGS